MAQSWFCSADRENVCSFASFGGLELGQTGLQRQVRCGRVDLERLHGSFECGRFEFADATFHG